MSAPLWPTAPPPPVGGAGVEIPAEVWVAVVVVVYEVSRRNVPVTQQLSATAALFAPAQNETVTSARIAAAAASEDECRQALAWWHSENPDVHGEDIVSKVPFGCARVEHGAAEVAPAPKCIDCGKNADIGFYCMDCTRAHWARSRAADVGAEE